MSQTTSPAGVARLKRFESCRLTVYADQQGIDPTTGKPAVPTIGWGHAYWHGADTITQAQADALFLSDLHPRELAVSSLVDGCDLNQDQFDACVSFAFNEGVYAFKTSSALACIRMGEMKGAALAFLLWDKVRDAKSGQLVYSPGLAARRLEEATLFYGSDPRAT